RPGRWSILVCARSAISSAVCCLWLGWPSSLSSPGPSGAAFIKPSPNYATGKHAACVPLENKKLNCRAKKAAVKLWHRARDFDRQTRKPGQRGGAVGPSALQVLHVLLFDFLNFQT